MGRPCRDCSGRTLAVCSAHTSPSKMAGNSMIVKFAVIRAREGPMAMEAIASDSSPAGRASWQRLRPLGLRFRPPSSGASTWRLGEKPPASCRSAEAHPKPSLASSRRPERVWALICPARSGTRCCSGGGACRAAAKAPSPLAALQAASEGAKGATPGLLWRGCAGDHCPPASGRGTPHPLPVAPWLCACLLPPPSLVWYLYSLLACLPVRLPACLPCLLAAGDGGRGE